MQLAARVALPCTARQQPNDEPTTTCPLPSQHQQGEQVKRNTVAHLSKRKALDTEYTFSSHDKEEMPACASSCASSLAETDQEVDLLAALVDAHGSADSSALLTGVCCPCCEMVHDGTVVRRAYKRPRLTAPPVVTLAHAWKAFNVDDEQQIRRHGSSHGQQQTPAMDVTAKPKSGAETTRSTARRRPQLLTPSCECNTSRLEKSAKESDVEQCDGSSQSRKRKRAGLVRSKRFIFSSTEHIQLLLQIKALESESYSPSEAHQLPSTCASALLHETAGINQPHWGWYVYPEDH